MGDYTEKTCLEGLPVFPILNPRLPDLMVGMFIGLVLALAWHWAAYAFH